MPKDFAKEFKFIFALLSSTRVPRDHSLFSTMTTHGSLNDFKNNRLS